MKRKKKVFSLMEINNYYLNFGKLASNIALIVQDNKKCRKK